MWVLIRLIIGSIFLVSGLEKLLSPYQNFLYAIQAYQALPSPIEVLVAQIFPWIELIMGAFIFIGLWTPWALRGALICFGIFVVMLGQALMRGLPLENCGCFGDLIHLKPRMEIVLDSASLLLTFLLLRNMLRTGKFSLDSYFDKK
jgi:triosephosphate isomerase